MLSQIRHLFEGCSGKERKKDDLTKDLSNNLATSLDTVQYANTFLNTCKTNIDILEDLFN